MSVFYPVWNAHSPEIAKNSEVSKSYGRLAVEWYKHLYSMRTKIDPARYFCIDYRNLVSNPATTIGNVYAHFGYTMGEAFRLRLEKTSRCNGEFKSEHNYTLDEFGLSKEWIQEELGELMDAYQLER